MCSEQNIDELYKNHTNRFRRFKDIGTQT